MDTGRFFRMDDLPDELRAAMESGEATLIASRDDLPDDMADMARQIDALLPPGQTISDTTFSDLLRAHERDGTGTPETLELLRNMARIERSFNAQLADFQEREEAEEAVERSLHDFVPRPADPGVIAGLKVLTNDAEVLCPVCQDNLSPGAEYLGFKCGHRLHRACALKWFESGDTCPVCKQSPA